MPPIPKSDSSPPTRLVRHPVSNSYSLDDLRDALNAQFQPLVITVGGEEYVLVNFMRSDATVRKAATEQLKAMDDDAHKNDYDTMVGLMEDLLSTVTADGKGPQLVAHFAGDAQLLTKVISLWIQETGLGEASGSPS